MEDAEVTLAKAGIHEGGSQPRLKRVRGFTCEVCYDDETKETLALNCDHRCKFFSSPSFLSLSPLSLFRTRADEKGMIERVVCKECYSHYIQSKVVDEGESRRIQCMGKNCNVIVDEKTVELLVNPEILTR